MIYLDANVILRYFLADDVEQHIISKDVIEGDQEIFVLDGVVVEIVYILTRTYGINRKLVSDKLAELFEQKRFCFENKTLVLGGIEYLKKKEPGFCGLYAVCMQEIEECGSLYF